MIQFGRNRSVAGKRKMGDPATPTSTTATTTTATDAMSPPRLAAAAKHKRTKISFSVRDDITESESSDTPSTVPCVSFEKMVSNDVLFYMMKYVWTTDMLFPCLLVCRRWNSVGKSVQLSIETTRSIAHGIYVDPTHLERIAMNPRMGAVVLDTPIMEAICRTVTNAHVLSKLLANNVNTRACWLTCLQSAIEKSNVTAIQYLTVTAATPTRTIRSGAEARSLLEHACRKMSNFSIHALCSRFPDVMAPHLRSNEFTRWCCASKLTVALVELLDHAPFRTPGNLLHVLRHALDTENEALVHKIFSTDRIDPLIHGARALHKACEKNWLSVARLLLDKRVSPSLGQTQTPLCMATANGHLNVIRLLLNYASVDPGYNFNRPVRIALETGHLDCALLLLNDSRVNVANHTQTSDSLLCVAASIPTLDPVFIETLLSRGEGVNPNEYNHAPIRIATATHNHRGLRVLLRHLDVRLSRTEHGRLLDLMVNVQGCRDVVDALVHEKRYSCHFSM